MCGEAERRLVIGFIVTVHVDPSDCRLLEMLDMSKSWFSINEVVRCEIASNLESVPYVREVSVNPNRKEVRT
jgi:hypothetical protein